ncbi:SurA N-terminal domain-containing protein [Stigmatella sp. ncwal1]|uniref:SurA N-terminal domain-containing protein n=1 Tax=Stigmatella ashevillensis TaxID=2995309 RepID=A0ABT5DMZ7_9BACT|nr:SurA N-terminal domain-containing protein [Stigmatella ashevillena]MDC0715032.1 SurA N-terminal domain-containing protein [Stigmatella ashevillena]
MDGMNARKVLSLVGIIAIAVVFTLQFGPGSTGFGGNGGPVVPSAVAVVNGKEIPLRDFSRVYAGQLNSLRNRGVPIPESYARQSLPSQVMDQLVTRELLSQAAERHGIVPSDEELRKLIHENVDFHKDGQFNFEQYKRALRDYYRTTEPKYEDELRRQLAAQKMIQVVNSGAVVSDDEVRARYEKDANQAKVVFARFLPTMYAAQVPAPTPAQVEEFQKAHASEISTYYESNRFMYQQAERAKARQILVKLAPDATAQQKAEAKARAEALHKELTEGGKDFATVARERSEDPGTKASGGDLGWVERASLEPTLAEAVFALAPNGISQPIETKLGWHVVKVEQKQAAQDKKLEEATPEIATTLYKQQKAKELAKAAAEKALASLKGGQTLQQLFPPEKEGQPALQRFETETRPEAVETGSFTAGGESVPYLGLAPALSTAAFTAPGPQVLDQVFPLSEGFVVAQVTERVKPSDETFTQKKDELREQTRRAKQIEMTESFLKALRETGTVVENNEAIQTIVGAS